MRSAYGCLMMTKLPTRALGMLSTRRRFAECDDPTFWSADDEISIAHGCLAGSIPAVELHMMCMCNVDTILIHIDI